MLFEMTKHVVRNDKCADTPFPLPYNLDYPTFDQHNGIRMLPTFLSQSITAGNGPFSSLGETGVTETQSSHVEYILDYNFVFYCGLCMHNSCQNLMQHTQ